MPIFGRINIVNPERSEKVIYDDLDIDQIVPGILVGYDVAASLPGDGLYGHIAIAIEIDMKIDEIRMIDITSYLLKAKLNISSWNEKIMLSVADSILQTFPNTLLDWDKQDGELWADRKSTRLNSSHRH